MGAFHKTRCHQVNNFYEKTLPIAENLSPRGEDFSLAHASAFVRLSGQSSGLIREMGGNIFRRVDDNATASL